MNNRIPAIRLTILILLFCATVLAGVVIANPYDLFVPRPAEKTPVTFQGVDEYQPTPGYLAPLFELGDTDGTPFILESLRSQQGVLLVFESTDCSYCQRELRTLDQASMDYRGQISVISISAEPGKTIQAYRRENGILRPWLLDSGQQITLQYRATKTPTHVFINRGGYITKTVIGYLDQAQLEKYLQEIL